MCIGSTLEAINIAVNTVETGLDLIYLSPHAIRNWILKQTGGKSSNGGSLGDDLANHLEVMNPGDKISSIGVTIGKGGSCLFQDAVDAVKCFHSCI